MAKPKRQYACQQCGATASQWAGQCGQCGDWNTLVEQAVQVVPKGANSRFSGYAADSSSILPMRDVVFEQQSRTSTGIKELDRVLGGGLVPGSVILLGGDPGIGKSTLLLQCLTQLSQHNTVLYVTGEESLQQVKMRAERLQLQCDNLQLLAETQLERILQLSQSNKPTVLVIDSIQTMYTDSLSSAPGGVGQVRETAARLVQFAKQTQTTLFMIGHVTKEGALAGPRVLEHMVDTVLYFEGERSGRFRLVRAIKNRFGAVNELGVFAMTDKGLREISNPSAIFLNRAGTDVPGSVVMVTWEGSRPMMVEVQALVDSSHLGNPRRVTVGLEQNRMAMLLAVLHRHGGIATYDQDVFVNVVGGVRVMETAVDLALLMAVYSSLRNQALPKDLVVFGEVGLAGEIRPVQSGIERMREAAKHGFKRAIVPKANAPKQKDIDGMIIQGVDHLQAALQLVRE